MTTLTGFWRLVRFIVRRDRVRLAVWVIAIAGVTVGSAASLPAVYPDQKSVESYVSLFGDNPALVAFAGPGYGFENPNIGLVLVNETQINGMIAVALMSIFLVNRHTRAEEESERAELIRSSVIGRHAPTAAIASVIVAANVLIGLACVAGFIGTGYQTSGSLALAASITCVGMIFAGIAAVAAQLTNSGRATLGLASGVLALSFVIRAVGDVADNGLSWLSPIGWAQAVRAYADERWWTLGLCAVAAFGLVVGAFWLSTRRDLGSGLVPPRPGNARAPGWMTRPLGLAFRLQRGALLGWTVALFLMGYIYGSIANDIQRMLDENQMMADMFKRSGAASLTDAFFAEGILQLALMAGGFALASSLRLLTEESAGRAEPILAGPTDRRTWASGHLVIAVAGTVLTVAAAGLGMGISYAIIVNDAAQIPRLVGTALVTVPAVLVLVGIAVALYGTVPNAARWAWGALAIVVVVGAFGELLRLPEWSRRISPFEHVPAVPAEDLTVLPIVVLTVIAAALVGFGLWSFRRRDLRTE